MAKQESETRRNKVLVRAAPCTNATTHNNNNTTQHTHIHKASMQVNDNSSGREQPRRKREAHSLHEPHHVQMQQEHTTTTHNIHICPFSMQMSDTIPVVEQESEDHWHAERRCWCMKGRARFHARTCAAARADQTAAPSHPKWATPHHLIWMDTAAMAPFVTL